MAAFLWASSGCSNACWRCRRLQSIRQHVISAWCGGELKFVYSRYSWSHSYERPRLAHLHGKRFMDAICCRTRACVDMAGYVGHALQIFLGHIVGMNHA